MLAFKLTDHNTIVKDNQESSETFYLSVKPLSKKMSVLYLYVDEESNYLASYQTINFNNYRLQQPVYVFSEWVIGFNLKKIKLPNLVFFAFKDKVQTVNYPLSAIIWPPAIKYSPQIVNLLKKHYQIVKLVKISLHKFSNI